MSLRPDLNRTYRDALGRAAAHRDPAPCIAPTLIDPRTSIGAGDRARKRLLDPFGLQPRTSSAAAQKNPVPGFTQPNFAALGAAYGATRMRADAQAHAQQVAVQQEAEHIRRAHTLIPTVPKEVREAYERQQLANEMGEE